MKHNIVFDTNILIAWSRKELNRDSFVLRFRDCKWIISEITEIELLSYPRLQPPEETEIKAFLKRCTIVRLTRRVKSETIRLRAQLQRKIPDSIIAATAVLSKAVLITNDSHLSNAAYPGLFVEPFV